MLSAAKVTEIYCMTDDLQGIYVAQEKIYGWE